MNVAKAKFLVVRRHWAQVGAEQERERIIKTLEETMDVYLKDQLLVEAAIIANAIAFIKGETDEG
jgi:hypothetical protein